VIAAGMIGNLLEWYDFGIYGYFAPSIGRVFFPTNDAVAQVLAAFGVFAVGYLMRPLGGALIGHIGDRYGRRAALIFSITTMAAPTFLVGLLPGYDILGLLAPVLLTLLRALQGLSVGGEWPTSFIFMIEQGPSNRRGLLGAVTSSGGLLGILTGSGLGALLTDMLPQAELDAWGWRLPFLFGLVAGITGLVLRRGIREVQQPGEGPATSPLLETLRDHGWLVARLAGVAAFSAVGFYLMFLYVVDWLQTVDGEPPARALTINTASMVAMIPVELLAGWLSDRLGRRPVMLGALSLAFMAALPLFWLMHHPSTIDVLVGQLGFVVLIGTILATQPALMVEVTPPDLRCTTIALGYNISVGVMGGLTPLAAAWLVHRTDMDLSPALMLMAAAALSFVAVLSLRAVAKT
jgi:MHS family proline/betaine transporter-like MFS transporter